MNYDVVIKDGLVVDPSQGIEEKKDIAVSEGKISLIGHRAEYNCSCISDGVRRQDRDPEAWI